MPPRTRRVLVVDDLEIVRDTTLMMSAEPVTSRQLLEALRLVLGDGGKVAMRHRDD